VQSCTSSFSSLPEPVGREARLSFAQERLWFLEQMAPGSAVYNVPMAWRMRGHLQRQALQEALTALTARHESLRTVFFEIDGCPRQKVAAVRPVPLAEIDLRLLPPGERESALLAEARREVRRPFDLRRDVLLRGLLLRLGDEEWGFVLTLHHIAADGWSVPVLYRELEEAYAAFLHGHAPEWAPPLQYVDYARRQREEMTGERLRGELDWWRRQLEGMPEGLVLPEEGTPAPTAEGGWQAMNLPQPLVTALEDLSRREQCSLYMTLLAAYLLLLSRYSGEDDILVGSPMANRFGRDLEGMIGFFVNTVVLRGNLRGDPAFRTFLRQVREMVLDAYDHQQAPFEKLVEMLRPQRQRDVSPLFRVLFVMQNDRPQAPQLEGLSLQRMELETGTSKFDLTLAVERKQAWEVGVEYRTRLFSATQMQRLLQHYRALLEGIVAHPEARLSQIPMLTDEEAVQLPRWSRGRHEAWRGGVHERVAEQAARRPGAVALQWSGGALSYGDLEARANQLAWGLLARGAGPETVVAVGLERSPELIVALLGVLKAGAAYLPFSPADPAPRRNQLLQDAAVKLVLRGEHAPLDLPHGMPSCSIAELMRGQASSRPCLPVSPEQLACVLSTSGSTGTPKGVEVLHRGIVRLLHGIDGLELDEKEVLLHLSPVSFDAATFEIWAALANGARCVLYPPQPPTPRELAEVLLRHRVSTLWLTTSLFNEVVDEAPQALAGIRQLLTGGEAISVGHVRRAMQRYPRLRLFNAYGPTEATTFTCCYGIPAVPTAETSSLPIGRPIANTEVWILGAGRQLQPVGVPGELYIGGDSLARGYRARPEFTAERFCAHPFAPGERLYRSGDKVCWRADGSIEFLGRMDEQVKLRGFRIEPGEIEAVLCRHPQVERAAVMVQGESTSRRLVAYLVTRTSVPTGVLRTFLRGQLPEFMIPAQFIRLERLPLTPQGKLDRRALPAPGAVLPVEPVQIGPRIPEELQLEKIWKSVLGLEAIAPESSFFDLGGHSLLAARLLARIEQGFGVRLSMAALFEHATLRAMAELLRGQSGERWQPPIVPIQPRGARVPFFCIGAGPFALPLVRCLGLEQPFLGVDLDNRHELQAPYRFDEIAASVVRAIRARQAEGPYQLGGWCLHGVVAYEAACQLRRQGAEVSTVALFDAPHPSFWRGVTMDSDRVRFHLRQARRMSLDEALRYARERWQGALFRAQTISWKMGYRFCLRTGVTPRGWLRDMLQVLYYAACEYEPEAYPGPVHLFRSQQRPGGSESDPAFGWRPLLGEHLIVREVPGTHRSMFQEPVVSVLAAELREILGSPAVYSYRGSALLAESCPEPNPGIHVGD